MFVINFIRHYQDLREFFKSLLERGLHGVELIASDAHAGLKEARKACFHGLGDLVLVAAPGRGASCDRIFVASAATPAEWHVACCFQAIGTQNPRQRRIGGPGSLARNGGNIEQGME